MSPTASTKRKPTRPRTPSPPSASPQTQSSHSCNSAPPAASRRASSQSPRTGIGSPSLTREMATLASSDGIRTGLFLPCRSSPRRMMELPAQSGMNPKLGIAEWIWREKCFPTVLIITLSNRIPPSALHDVVVLTVMVQKFEIFYSASIVN